VIAFETKEVREFMIKSAINNTGPDQVTSFIKSLSKHNIEQFTATGGKIYCGTVGPNEALVMPFDWVWTERAGDVGDCLGVKIAFFLSSDEEAMISVNRWLISCRKQNQFLLNATEVITEQNAD
jgi:hypothetical protein